MGVARASLLPAHNGGVVSEYLKLSAGLLIVCCFSVGLVSLLIGGYHAIFDGDATMAIGGGALIAFASFFGTWYSRHFENQAPKD